MIILYYNLILVQDYYLYYYYFTLVSIGFDRTTTHAHLFLIQFPIPTYNISLLLFSVVLFVKNSFCQYCMKREPHTTHNGVELRFVFASSLAKYQYSINNETN